MRLSRQIANTASTVSGDSVQHRIDMALKYAEAMLSSNTNNQYWYSNQGNQPWTALEGILSYMETNNIPRGSELIASQAIPNAPASSTSNKLFAHCSSFASTVYNLSGIEGLRTTSPSDYLDKGFISFTTWSGGEYQIPSWDASTIDSYLKPGDILWSQDSDGNYIHVAMYLGDKKIIEALNSSSGIVISSYSFSWNNTSRRWQRGLRYTQIV